MSDQMFRQAYDALIERMSDPPSYEVIASTPVTTTTPGGWRSKAVVLGLSLVAVLGFVGLALLIAPDEQDSGISGGVTACESPPADERTIPDSGFVLTVTPNPVSPGGQAELMLDVAPDAPDDIANQPSGEIITGAVASLQCWNGAEWVETHHLFKGGFGQPYVEIEPGVTITFPAVGLLIDEPHSIELPPLPPGLYRIEDAAQIGARSYPVYALVEVDVNPPVVTTDPSSTTGQEPHLTCVSDETETAHFDYAENAKGFTTIEAALDDFKDGEPWRLREDWHDLIQGETSASPVEFTDVDGLVYLLVELVDSGNGWLVVGYDTCNLPSS